MENFEECAGPFLALIVQRTTEPPERRTQDMGNLLVKTTKSNCTEALFVVAYDRLAFATMSSIMTGYGPTASFAADQVRRPITVDMPGAESFAVLAAIVEGNRRRGTEGTRDKTDKRIPRKAVFVITTGAFVKGFLRYYFSKVANRPEDAALDDFIAPGTAIVIETNTHGVKILQVQGVGREHRA